MTSSSRCGPRVFWLAPPVVFPCLLVIGLTTPTTDRHVYVNPFLPTLTVVVFFPCACPSGGGGGGPRHDYTRTIRTNPSARPNSSVLSLSLPLSLLPSPSSLPYNRLRKKPVFFLRGTSLFSLFMRLTQSGQYERASGSFPEVYPPRALPINWTAAVLLFF